MSDRQTALTRYDDAKRALAEAHRFDEVKTIHDKAAAWEEYARRAKDTDMIVLATDIRMRAERRAGELLVEMAARRERETKGGDRRSKSQPATLIASPPKLSDLKINKTQSSRWQALAALADHAFEAKVERASKQAYDGIARRFIKEEKIKRAKERHAKIIEHGCVVDDLVAVAESGKRFSVILGDPPWAYENSGALGVSANHYDTQSIEQIMKLPVAQLAADDCVLFLWCTWPHITVGLHVEVFKAWGFAPKTAGFVWVKENPSGNGLHTGNGFYTLSNSEVCLLAKKGSPQRLNADVHEIVMAPFTKHSEKPEEVRRRIERLYAGPYLELYARKAVPGWTCWGNEIPRAQFAEAAE
jgi:N6-adenosine-specific RNA methylase IME4